MTDRKKPGVAFWVAVPLAVVALYILSFGPACWLTAGRHGRMTPYHPVMIVYVPFGMILGSETYRGKWPSKLLHRWATLMARKDHAVSVPTRWDGTSVWTFFDRR